jgi:surface antigen
MPVRPRHALSLLALALPLPVVLSGATYSPGTGAGALSDAIPDRVPVLREEITPSPFARQRSQRPAPRRAASRGHRAAAPRRHHTATSTTVRTHPTTHVTTGYPWASDMSGGNDPWGFTKRQCVSYVAWRLDRVGRPLYSRQGWGSASGWDDVARRRGVTVTSRPKLGSVAQWNAGESSRLYVSGASRGTFVAGSYGHVAWVTEVYSDGSVQVAQYNGNGTRSYSSMRVFAPRFLRL